ncbi:ABC transporter permease [Flavobacterium kingsejongi]|uniref:ABC transporter permease n=1 Tax=Flavobacterium kingsejongi TaxID=1678728 RepID=A0A2S1LLQ1_9FLAO|nr:ABC transporter permease [Flavobacterium kingsejongi]AWG24690.1 ABC transporter permease [Flavobacterium kingsejongi]
MTTSIDIQLFLPHRAPMLMVDCIIEIGCEAVITQFTIEGDNIFVQNGFFSETGMIENAAQTCSSIVAQSFFAEGDVENKERLNVLGFISTIKTLTIYGLPPVNETIVTKSTLISKYDAEHYTTCLMDCKTYLGTQLLMKGEINLFIQEKSNEKERSTTG